jgi:glycosyltransferase involved in cell wall biosynthesis
MGRIMTEKYGSTICCTVVSNIAFLELGQAAPRTRGLQRVGFLSNLLPTKGIDRFLDLAREIASDGLKAEIAGPFPDEETRKYVMERIAMMPHVTYHGALYGRAKTEFLRHIDLFVFPSRYMNEAEPLVLYEAMAEGLPISATSRGCVPDMLNCTGSVLLDQNAEDLEVLVSRIRYWHNNPSAFAAAAVSAHAGFKALFADRDNQYQRLIRVFTDRTQC